MPPIPALYCHIPFCHSICPFCAFAIHRDHPRRHAPYLSALQKEITLRGRQYRGGEQSITTLYLGGGTPSILTPVELEELLDCIRGNFQFAPSPEIAMEINPEDAAPDYLAGLRKAGINRVSLGLQSLDGNTLQALGRNHGAEDGIRALQAIRDSDIENFNIDLMFGAPGVAGEFFRKDLEKAIGWRPNHISLYGLEIEKGTLFSRDREVTEWADSHREEQADQYLWAADFLVQAGYSHYEVSNFCRPGYESRNNLSVWGGSNYLGFGIGAHSYVAGRRWYNERHIRPYQGKMKDGKEPVAFQEQLSREQRANEGLMLALRQVAGLDIPEWEKEHGFRWGEARKEVSERLCNEGKASLAGGRLALSATGMLLADGITVQLMVT